MRFLNPLLALVLLLVLTVLLVGTQVPSSHPTSSLPAHFFSTPTYAPLTALPITAIALQSSTPCSLPDTCSLVITITFASPQYSPLRYSFKFFNACTNLTTELSPATFNLPHFTTLTLNTHLYLPAATAASLTVVTSTPSVAASSPLLLGTTTCP